MSWMNKYAIAVRLMIRTSMLKLDWDRLWVMIYLPEKNVPDSKRIRNIPNGGWRFTTIVSISDWEVLMTPAIANGSSRTLMRDITASTSSKN
jgi:hypothetical protein